MTSSECNYIVVGAGSAGCIIARRLAESTDAQVVLLEAGIDDRHWRVRMPGAVRSHYDLSSPFNWHFWTTPQTHLDQRAIYQPRGKCLGGSSSINGMVYLRGHALDYETWCQMGASGWSYGQVLPYFKRLESVAYGDSQYRGQTGPVHVTRIESLTALEQAFLDAGQQAGHVFTNDVNGHQQEGFCRFDMSVQGGVRASTAQAYLHQRPALENLRIERRALVHRVNVDGSRVTGVEYAQDGERKSLTASEEVILCAGVFGSAQILMLSGIGPQPQLRAHGIETKLHREGVGENLQDHPEVHIQHRCKQPVTLNGYMRPDRKVRAGLEWFMHKTGVCSRNQANAGAFLCSSQSVAHPDIQFHFFPCFFSGEWHIRSDEHGYLLDTGPMRPTSRGTVRLRSSDPSQPLLIDPNYLATEADRQSMREAVALARETLSQAAFEPFDAGEHTPGSATQSRNDIDAFIRQHTASAYHPVGTCKMGDENDPRAVVDSQGRVYGLEAIRVADASIMPSVVSANTNAASMMIGEKLADAILGREPLPALDLAYATQAD